MENLFEIFLRQWTLPAIQQAFYQLCINRGVDPTDHLNVYEKLKQADRFCDNSFKQKQLWDLLDRRRQQKVYQNQTVCRELNVLIVGAGPCGLRAAIECTLLGAHVVVVDSRDKFTRNNVVHLWKFVIEDLKNLGAKIFFPKFCTGSIEHISIRKLQFILLKVALVLGVQFYDKVEYKDLKEPQDGKSWRAIFEPSDHILSNYEFDVVIGASGKYKCLPAFKHNPVRGKLAIGITANFVRHHNKEEDSVPEIQGVAYVYKQDYFDDLERKTKIQLENIVYYKGDTHYFVMCGKKQNLLAKGVIKSDKDDVRALLANENVDRDMLCKYVTQVVDYVTEGKLGQLEFALNARKKPDIAAFDFTTLESADHSTRFVKYMGHPLILTLVGDYLHEPFWPTGSGCARGFLSVMDTAWLLRNVGLGKEPMARLLAEREGIYSLLSQTQPNNLSISYHSYTIDPKTRYTQFNPTIPCVEHLMGTDNAAEDLDKTIMRTDHQMVNNKLMQIYSLFRFCYMAASSKKIRISSFSRSSWADGCALAAMISKYNLDFKTTVPITSLYNPATLCLEAFAYAEDELGVLRPCKTQYEWAVLDEPARIEYLEKLVEVLRSNPYYAKNCMSPTLLINFNRDNALASAIQARILRPKQFLQNNATIDPIFNFDPIETSKNVTKRLKQQKLDSTLAILSNPIAALPSLPKNRRSSIEPLNPELIYKIDKIASGSYARSEQHRSPNKAIIKRTEEAQTPDENARQEESKPEKQGVFAHLKDLVLTLKLKIETGHFAEQFRESDKSSKLDETLKHGSLAGLRNVSRYRKQFDSDRNCSSRQRTSSSKSTTDSTTSSRVSSLLPSETSSTEEDHEHPADPMHIRASNGSLPSNDLNAQQQLKSSFAVPGHSNVVYRSTTQHQFANNRRPISTPNMLTSPDLCKTFGYRKPQQQTVTAAHQQIMKNVLGRRMRLCALCNGEVYLAEQKLVDDRLCVHRQCFRCSFCNRVLEVGKAYIDRSFVDKFGVRWYCAQHSNKPVEDKLQQLLKVAGKQNKSSTAVAIVSPTKLTAQKSAKCVGLPYSRRTCIKSSSTESSANSLDEIKRIHDAAKTLLAHYETAPRPPTPPSKKNGRLSSSTKYRKRLSDLNSPTKLIEACKQRTNQRLKSLGLEKVAIDENSELQTMKTSELKSKWQKSEYSSSDQENDRQSNESFEEDQYYAETVDEEEEFSDVNEFVSDDEQQFDNDDAWSELRSYLETVMTDSQQTIPFGDLTEAQARDLIEAFNRRSLLSHFNNLQTPQTFRQASITFDPNTPYFTPREGRADTVPETKSVNLPNSNDVYYTPRTTLKTPVLVRRSSTLDQQPQMMSQVEQLKQKIEQNASQFEKDRLKNDQMISQTPRRVSRQRFRRDPRRATVAVDLKRESLTPTGPLAAASSTTQQKTDMNPDTDIVKLCRSPSVQQRRRALHIRPTDGNLERVIREVELMKNRRKNEKERQLQALQRRMHEVEVRMKQVYKVGLYLEQSLTKDPRNKWELEQWLNYVQQYEELQNEDKQLKLKVKICQLDDEYQQLKARLHTHQDTTMTTDNHMDREKNEKELMQRLLDLLDEKDTNKTMLHELQSNQRTRTLPVELVKNAPSYTCYSAVFLENKPKPSTKPASYSNSNKSVLYKDRIPV